MPQILVVEDDAQYRQMLVQMLVQDGHHVETAGDGREAIAVLQRVRPDLIITDIMMPNMDGVEFIMELANQSHETPIIAISGGRRSISPTFNLQSASMLGVKTTLAKPFSRADFREAVAAALA